MSLIPITVLTGFLGSGKTTLLNKLMKDTRDENVVIIVNEYGDVGIDHQLVLTNEQEKIFQMNNGCMCCVLLEDLIDMFLAILQVAEKGSAPIDRIIIETSGLAEPSPIAQTIIRTPLLNEHFVVDSLITLVDAKNGLYQLENYNEAVEQVGFADKIFLTKTDLTDTREVNRLKKVLNKINSLVDTDVLNMNTVTYEDIVGLDLFDRSISGAKNVNVDIDHMINNHTINNHQQSGHHDHDRHHEGHGHGSHHHIHTDVDTCVITSNSPLPEEQVGSWLRLLIFQYGMDLMRYKGILSIEGQPCQIVLQGVNMVYKLEEGQAWKGSPETKIVLIGKNLPQKEITDMLLVDSKKSISDHQLRNSYE